MSALSEVRSLQIISDQSNLAVSDHQIWPMKEMFWDNNGQRIDLLRYGSSSFSKMTTTLMNIMFLQEEQAESYIIESAFSTSKKKPLCLNKIELLLAAVLAKWFPTTTDESKKNTIIIKLKSIINSKCRDSKKRLKIEESRKAQMSE